MNPLRKPSHRVYSDDLQLSVVARPSNKTSRRVLARYSHKLGGHSYTSPILFSNHDWERRRKAAERSLELEEPYELGGVPARTKLKYKVVDYDDFYWEIQKRRNEK